MTMYASCGHECRDNDGPDGMGNRGSWKSEDCDAVTGFHPAVSYGSLCNACLATYRAEGLILDTEADEDRYLLGRQNMNPKAWPATTNVITIPRWLGGAWTARYIIRHAWTRWLILWPIIKWHETTGDKTP
jgi:hypothetical protein